jgi:hypothetical protein
MKLQGNSILNDQNQVVAMVFASEDGLRIRFPDFAVGPLADRLHLDLGVPAELHIDLRFKPVPRPPR